LHPTQIENSKNTLYFENENPKIKIMHSRKVDPEKIIVFHKQKSNPIPDKKNP